MESIFAENYSADGQNTSLPSCKACGNHVKTMCKRKWNEGNLEINPFVVLCPCFLRASFHFIIFAL